MERAVEEVRAAGAPAGAPPPTGLVADLSSMAEVRSLAQRVQAAHPHLDVLINNAGVYEEQLRTTADGLEMTWAVNVAAPFLLTSLLLGAVRERVVNVSSISAASSLDWGNLQQVGWGALMIWCDLQAMAWRPLKQAAGPGPPSNGKPNPTQPEAGAGL